MFNLSFRMMLRRNLFGNRGTIASVDCWAAQPSVASTVARFAGLVVVNLARQSQSLFRFDRIETGL
jgi:hypothetical protein